MLNFMKHAREARLAMRPDGALQDWAVYSVQRDDGPVTVVIEQRDQRR
jgi:hypothetical protein